MGRLQASRTYWDLVTFRYPIAPIRWEIPFSMLSRTEAPVTILPNVVDLARLLEYSYSSADIIFNMIIKSYFFKSLKFCFVYLLAIYKHQSA